MYHCVRCSGLVPKVRSYSVYSSFFSLDMRCITQLSGGQNIGSGGLRSLEHTIRALETYELGELWGKYGLVGDLIVCCKPTLTSISLINILLAFYRRLSTSQYLRNHYA